jgi:hypothetical protein
LGLRISRPPLFFPPMTGSFVAAIDSRCTQPMRPGWSASGPAARRGADVGEPENAGLPSYAVRSMGHHPR